MAGSELKFPRSLRVLDYNNSHSKGLWEIQLDSQELCILLTQGGSDVYHSHFLIFGPGQVSVTPAAESWAGFVFTLGEEDSANLNTMR